jgi:hypothetical protein
MFPLQVVLEAKQHTIHLRPWQKGDEASCQRHVNNRNVWLNLRDRIPHPYSMEDAIFWVNLNTSARDANPEKPPTELAIVVDGEAVGGVGLMLNDPNDVKRRW